MSSLRRILSFAHSPPPPPAEASRLARHHSLPHIVYQPESILLRPCPTRLLNPTRLLKTSHGTCSITGIKSSSSLCRAMSDKFDESRLRDFMSGGCAFVPDWCSTEDQPSACTERAFVRSLSRKESKVGVHSLDLDSSVVYKELRESIRRLQEELPARFSNSSESATNNKVKPKLMKNLDSCSSNVKGRPMSLRMLKMKLSKVPEARNCQEIKQQHTVIDNSSSNQCNLQTNDGLRDVGDSVGSAFASLILIMKMLHQQILWMRRSLKSESDNGLHDVVDKVHAEMQDSFLWLFQQVFSCTPKLMVLTMVLLADFTAHSMGKHVALAVGEPPTASVVAIESLARGVVVEGLSLRERSAGNSIRIELSTSEEPFHETSMSEGGEGNGGERSVEVGGGMDGHAMPNRLGESRAMSVEDDTRGGVNDASLPGFSTLLCEEGCPNAESGDTKEDRMLSLMRAAVSKELDSRPDNNSAILDTKTKHMFVAPVRAPELEADDYPCYDRTDLNYQHEISMDPANPLLLANYAQFLHLVRHDHGRAEKLFKSAMRADPLDGDVMGRFASFLWVAKGDVEGADRLYKAAVAADPTNSFHAGCYAYFLWNSSAGQEDIPTACSPHQQVATSS